MKYINFLNAMSKITIGLLLFVHALGVSAGMTVQCRIDSQQFLDSGAIDKYTDSYVLSAPATKEAGSYMAFNNESYELWVKAHAYLKKEKELSVTAYSIVLIDKKSHRMSEATSFRQEEKSRAELTVHKLDSGFQPSGRLVFSCFEI